MSIYEEKKSSKLTFPEFEDIKVSTKTFIIVTNIIINIDKLYEYLPVTNYVLIPKKRGRKKKKEEFIDENKDIATGSIITLEYQNNVRGVNLKKKKKDKKKRGNYFRNSVTIVMIIDNKKINFKVSRNGKFQMTGCKKSIQAEECIKFFWFYIKDSDIYQLKMNEANPIAIFVPVMRNIDFSLNFYVDREKLDEYFNTCTDNHSLLETSFGYTGVNIKIPIDKPLIDLKLKQITYINNEWTEPKYVNYTNYLDMLETKDVLKKTSKTKYNTFLVFHSGKVIMSGMEASYMKNVYYNFLDIIRDCYDIIEERLNPQL